MSLFTLTDGVTPVEYVDEMRQDYIDYAMSTIVGRALPDVRDGLKPVHRRIIYSMMENGFTADKPHKKCARIVGDVLGRYHPHGDTAVYDALVRMAQDFSLRHPLIDGHGNFGSMDGDSAAAMRYTEARLAPLALEMTRGIEKETVEFIPTYDNDREEPIVLPGRFPNLLVNGSSGIAVGMAVSLPPHNLNDVVKACCHLIDKPMATTADLARILQGPDFPTGGQVIKDDKLLSAYETGRGAIAIRGKAQIQKEGGKTLIVISEIPYTMASQKLKLLEQIGELDEKKKVEGIAEVRDESSRQGVRIVVELKRTANAEDVLNRIYKFTKLSDTFSYNCTVLVNGEPRVLSLKEVIQHYIAFQEEIVRREAAFDLKKALEEKEVSEGLVSAVGCMDTIIACIRASENAQKARAVLMGEGIQSLEVTPVVKKSAQKYFSFTERQATAILELRLQRLTRLEISVLEEKLERINSEVKRLNQLLYEPGQIAVYIKEDLRKLAKKYGDPRRTETVQPQAAVIEVKPIQTEDAPGYVVVDDKNYIKWVGQRSLGESREGIRLMLPCSRLENILLMDQRGMCVAMSAEKFPEAKWRDKGKQVNTLTKLEEVRGLLPLKESQGQLLLTVSAAGLLKKTPLEEYRSLSRTAAGVKLKQNDAVAMVELIADTGKEQLVLITEKGYVLRVPLKEVPITGRYTGGVLGIKLKDDSVKLAVVLADIKDDLAVTTHDGQEVMVPSKTIPSGRAVRGKRMLTSVAVSVNVVEKAPVEEEMSLFKLE